MGEDPWGNEARLCAEVWRKLLADYPADKREFLVGVMEKGYQYIKESEVEEISEVATRNYSLFINNEDKIDAVLEEEARLGFIKEVEHKPKVVSARGAVPKKDSDKLRLITDLSRPVGLSLNEKVIPPKFKMQTVDDALKLVRKGCWMAKIDLQGKFLRFLS